MQFLRNFQKAEVPWIDFSSLIIIFCFLILLLCLCLISWKHFWVFILIFSNAHLQNAPPPVPHPRRISDDSLTVYSGGFLSRDSGSIWLAHPRSSLSVQRDLSSGFKKFLGLWAAVQGFPGELPGRLKEFLPQPHQEHFCFWLSGVLAFPVRFWVRFASWTKQYRNTSDLEGSLPFSGNNERAWNRALYPWESKVADKGKGSLFWMSLTSSDPRRCLIDVCALNLITGAREPLA